MIKWRKTGVKVLALLCPRSKYVLVRRQRVQLAIKEARIDRLRRKI